MVLGLDPVTHLGHAAALFRRVVRNELSRFALYFHFWQLLHSFPGIARCLSQAAKARAPITQSTHARRKGKSILITCASTGIGAAAARAFAQYGANVVVHYQRRRVLLHYNSSKDQAEEVAQDMRALGVTAITVGADVRDSKAIDAAVAQVVDSFGKIDVLINNAGSLVKREPIASATDELFDEIMHINARSVVALTGAALPSLRSGGGSIINVTSVAARNGGGPGALLYAASKGFVSTITKGMAKELMPDRIRVNAVAPGVTQTPFQERFRTPEQLESFRKSIPMGFIGEPDDCSGAFLYLASEAMSRYVTGQIIDVNGGQLMP
ncbi:3-oxoacyl-[acyl-carrier protein] reductase [Candidatus Paraburkholderia kirkii UZHbot1]|uniref:3-oxoacyl-[acyl-carrier protein] reductase n=1 Tax=Candidatus Paraburkholderia kirkii UZHbot1 TaxID=1055526 RepID=G4MHC5_9BURK|nr:3-oxoacyl-[acyl-carrier protein] reductase [Candidatus Paraburkholderia kirkii UZHbot1]